MYSHARLYTRRHIHDIPLNTIIFPLILPWNPIAYPLVPPCCSPPRCWTSRATRRSRRLLGVELSAVSASTATQGGGGNTGTSWDLTYEKRMENGDLTYGKRVIWPKTGAWSYQLVRQILAFHPQSMEMMQWDDDHWDSNRTLGLYYGRCWGLIGI